MCGYKMEGVGMARRQLEACLFKLWPLKLANVLYNKRIKYNQKECRKTNPQIEYHQKPLTTNEIDNKTTQRIISCNFGTQLL